MMMILPLVLTLVSHTICNTRDAFIDQLNNKYGEFQIAIGIMNSTIAIELFANKDTGTWTIIQSNARGQSCLMLSGDGWQDVVIEPTKEEI